MQGVAASLGALHTWTITCLRTSGSVRRTSDLLNASPAAAPPASGFGRAARPGLAQTGNEPLVVIAQATQNMECVSCRRGA